MRGLLCGFLAILAAFSVGCHHNTRRNCGCNQCGRSGGPTPVARIPHGEMQQMMAGPGGPQGPTVAYPYYTTRAPRDFLLNNPPSIGP